MMAFRIFVMLCCFVVMSCRFLRHFVSPFGSIGRHCPP
jgi:hypothetical protein